jgi:hypothetical protein
MSYHELAFVSNKPLEININTVDRSLINKKDIDTDRWYVDYPTKAGYYRVLRYDINPYLYKLDILFYNKEHGYWYDSYQSSLIHIPVPLWQDLSCSSL